MKINFVDLRRGGSRTARTLAVVWVLQILSLSIAWLVVPALAGEPVAATVNGVPISLETVDRAVNEKVPRISGHGSISESRRVALRAEVLEDLITEELLVQEAKRRGLTVAASAIDEEAVKVKKRFPSDGDFTRALARNGISDEQFRKGLERHLLARQVLDREVISKVTVTEQTMKAYYEADPSRFVVPDQAQYRQLVIAVDPGGSAEEWKAAQVRAASRAKQARGGKNFAALTKAQSQDRDSREQGGEMGWVHRGQLEHDDETAIFGLKPGEVSEPVRTLRGYAVYQLVAKKPQRPLRYNELNKERLADELRRAEIARLRSAWLSDLRHRAKVEIRPTEP